MIDRRHLLAGAVAGTAALVAGPARACTITAQRPARFSDRACRQAIGQWVRLLNDGPAMSDEALADQVDGISLDDRLVDSALAEAPETFSERHHAFYRHFSRSGGRPDPRPIRLREVNPIRRLRNRASYQFTIERYSYHPADLEGCNGMFVHDEYYGTDLRSLLAELRDNRIVAVRAFPEWYLEQPSQERGA